MFTMWTNGCFGGRVENGDVWGLIWNIDETRQIRLFNFHKGFEPENDRILE